LLPFIAGAGDESRTRDLNLGKVALYQLSYSRAILQNNSIEHLAVYYLCTATFVLLKRRYQYVQTNRPNEYFRTSLPESGAGDESRTRDLNLGKVALYQLSYSRTASCFRRIHFQNRPHRRDEIMYKALKRVNPFCCGPAASCRELYRMRESVIQIA
jgi:hypothetical protein